MKSGDIFNDNDPHLVVPSVNFVQTVCSSCETPITLQTNHQINGMASCWYCVQDHMISRNICPRPYRVPRSRKFTNRSDNNNTAWYTRGQATSCITTVAATEAFLKDPNGGL